MLHPLSVGWGCFFIQFCQEEGDLMELDDDLFPYDHETEESDK